MGVQNRVPQDELGLIERIVYAVVTHHRRIFQKKVLPPNKLLQARQDPVHPHRAALNRLANLLVLEVRCRADYVEDLKAHDNDILVRARHQGGAGGRFLEAQALAVPELVVQVASNRLRLPDAVAVPVQHGKHPEGPRDVRVRLEVEPVAADDVLQGDALVLELDLGILEGVPDALRATPRVKVAERDVGGAGGEGAPREGGGGAREEPGGASERRGEHCR
mmetsp:Transcript_22822/g.57129  ORF Transcript_22822/g.57129 Transcript_22822/m.57129 type:complete len:221 (+) Transcript_22822:207-869(+)